MVVFALALETCTVSHFLHELRKLVSVCRASMLHPQYFLRRSLTETFRPLTSMVVAKYGIHSPHNCGLCYHVRVPIVCEHLLAIPIVSQSHVHWAEGGGVMYSRSTGGMLSLDTSTTRYRQWGGSYASKIQLAYVWREDVGQQIYTAYLVGFLCCFP